jgi:hypothetical protein
MKKKTVLLLLLLVPLALHSQFEQKISVNLSGGMFTTMGASVYQPDYWASSEDDIPLQISNYKPGPDAMLGIQYNLNRHFSIQVDVGVLFSGSWYFDVGEDINYTEFWVWDPDDEEILLTSGENELTLKNIGIGITPKYYIRPGKKINPYLFAGISLNFTSTTFEDNYWAALKEFGLLDPPDDPPERANIEKNIGPGFFPGVGLDLALGDRFSLFLLSGIHVVMLKEGNFYTPEQQENLKALSAQAGIRVSFVKSKEL